jgi:spermidine synthase
MRLLLLGDIRWSKKNGLIRTTPEGEIWSGGIKQTSGRYADIWRDALTKAEIAAAPERILMLGLAGGGALPALQQRYPSAEVTCVEYDPIMADIARELLAKAEIPLPHIVISDAKEALETLTEQYGLIIVDLFVGTPPSPLVSEDSFWEAVKERLVPGGTVILNVATTPTGIRTAQKHLARSKAWRYDVNTLCALS